MEWLSKVTEWLLNLVKKIFEALWTFVYDVAVRIFDAVLSVIAGIINAFPAPSFLSTYSIGGLLADISPTLLWFLAQFNIGAAFSVIGAAWVFRLGRKALTLGQW